MLKSPGIVFLIASAAALPAAAQESADANTPPEAYRRLMECRALTDPARRLSCFDDSAAALEGATQRREIVISDKRALKQAKRGLFGFSAPVGRLMGFGGDSDDADQVAEVASTVLQARRAKDGWRLDLGDGSTWEQNDTRDFVLSPKSGDPVRITRGALGTYFLSVKSQRALRMRRVK